MNRIRELREKRGITQTELGEAIGVDHSAIARYERGSRRVNVETARKLCDFFGCSIGYLLYQPEASALDDASVIEAYHALSDRDRTFVDMIFRDYLV